MTLSMEREVVGANSMWRCVLAQAVHDLYGGKPQYRSEAIRWICTQDFLTVCDFANIEPEGMKEQLLDLVKLPDTLAKKYGKLLRSRIIYGVHHCH